MLYVYCMIGLIKLCLLLSAAWLLLLIIVTYQIAEENSIQKQAGSA